MLAVLNELTYQVYIKVSVTQASQNQTKIKEGFVNKISEALTLYSKISCHGYNIRNYFVEM